MITVGVRELKNQFSQYLQYVKDGERVIITEHNKIIAEICLPQKNGNTLPIEEKLMQLGREGKIIPAKRQKSCVKIPETREKLDWMAEYNKTRADRV